MTLRAGGQEMSEHDMHDMMDHGADTSSNEESGKSQGLQGIVKSRYFAHGVTVAVLLVGFLLARRLGFGGRLLPIVGLFAVLMVGRSFMHGGHGSHGEQGSYGGHGAHGAHGGCGGSSRQRPESGQVRTNGGDSTSPDKDEVDRQSSHQGHSGCH